MIEMRLTAGGMDHTPKAKGAGRDTDRTQTRQQQKRGEQRGPEGSIRGWSDCTETRNRALDWPRAGWRQGLASSEGGGTQPRLHCCSGKPRGGDRRAGGQG